MNKGPSAPLLVIPARAQSIRFPLKVLAPIQGKPMVQHVWEAAIRVKNRGDCIVATDDLRVLEAVQSFGGEAQLTPDTLNSGSDRVAFIARQSDAEIVVNIQGDEPLISTTAIENLINALQSSKMDIATLCVERLSPTEILDPNVVKVVTDGAGRALYFSRQPLASDLNGLFYKHIGIYAFRRAALLEFCGLAPSTLEKVERLEQLRALENGFRIQVVRVESDTISVDIPEDLARVETFLSKPDTK